MKTGIELIAEERDRQITEEGWTAENDLKYADGELVEAAICYAIEGRVGTVADQVFKTIWPWDKKWWKPTDRITNLKKAGALIAAEIDRLNHDR